MCRNLFSLFLVVLLSGCGTVDKIKSSFTAEDNSIPPTPLTDIAQRIDLDELWSKDVGDGSDEKYLKLTPSINSGRVYIAENGGDLLALDMNTGSVIWDTDTDQPISGGPGSSDTQVLIGTQEGQVIAYDPETGEQLWLSQLTSEILSRPAVSNGIVVARTIDGKIFGLDDATGKRIWIYDHKVPALTLRGTGNPIIDSGLVLCGFDGGRMVALEIGTGKLIWEARISRAKGANELDRMVDIDAELIIDAGTIFVSTFQGNVAAVDLNTGSILWLRNISSFAGLAVSDELVFVSDEESNLWALDRFTGDSVWKQEMLYGRALTAPVVQNDYVVVGDLEGYMHWFDSSTGKIVARDQVSESKMISAPMVNEDILFAYASDGTMNAYRIAGVNSIAVEDIETAIEEDIKLEEVAEDSVPDTDIADEYGEASEATSNDDEGFSFKNLFDIFGSDDEEDDESIDTD